MASTVRAGRSPDECGMVQFAGPHGGFVDVGDEDRVRGQHDVLAVDLADTVPRSLWRTA